MNRRLPATIITGFLGSGKTTLIRKLLLNSGRKLAVIVNEFGLVGIDGDLIKSCGFCLEEEIEGRIIELNNGCLCCTVQDDFLPAIEKILSNSKNLDGVVIETSGLALPKPLVKALEWPEIRTNIFVNGVISVVDGEALSQGSPVIDFKSVEEQRSNDKNIEHQTSIEDLFSNQIKASDIVLISKVDKIDSIKLEKVKNHIKPYLRNGAQYFSIVNGLIDYELILDSYYSEQENLSLSGLKNTKHEHEDEHKHEHLEAFTKSIRMEIDLTREWIEKKLPSLCIKFNIIRLKGRIWLTNKKIPLQVQMVGPRINTWFESVPESAWQPDKSGIDLVVISLEEISLDKLLEDIKRYS
tara:strand:+ start:1875 stop:2936 length:1062 start_codon:yes stop_codon:yes gene_type:complete